MKNLPKKLLQTLFLSLIFSGYVYAGSGAGGEILFSNDSNKPVSVTFNGVGCAGIFHQLDFVCQKYDYIAPHDSKLYKYNWGVTTTWMNVMAPTVIWYNHALDNAPCYFNRRHPLYKYCYAYYHYVSTHAYKESPYSFKG